MKKESINILDKINFELGKLAKDPMNIKDYSRFYRDGREHIGVPIPLVRKISSEAFKEIKNLDNKQIFALCERLLAEKGFGYRTIAFDWAYRIKKGYQKEDFKIFEKWVEKYVDTWDTCDDLCTHAFGEFVYQFPEFVPQLICWAKSPNMWFRRVSAVALIYSLRKGKYLDDAFEIAESLLRDDEDLVQKGYGWMLKEATKKYEKDIFEFVMKNKKLMSRTALRYAIEKMPKKLKVEAMGK